MVVVDRLSKYVHFIPLKYPFTEISVAKAFLNHVVSLHGLPSLIVSDRDKLFVSTFWKTLFQLQGTQLRMSSSYHPQTDGQTEAINCTMEQYLRCFASDQPRKWLEWLAWAEYSYNTTVHSATKVSSFEAVYGMPPPTLTSYVPGTTKLAAVDDLLPTKETILKELRHNLQVAGNRMKVLVDKHRRDKLAPQFFGPCKILARVGPVYNVFRVNQLKKYVGSSLPVSPTLPASTNVSDTPILSQPEAVLASRIIHKEKYRPRKEILVKWSRAPLEDTAWENCWRFSRTYPSFVLKDKDA
ncbi:hypothetical protein ACOSP7_005046 [Xanthoceras sorbifolium]